MSEETLKIVITGDASGIVPAGKQASDAINKISQSAAEWDKRARELNLQTNYTSRSFATLASSADKFAAPAAAVEQSLSRVNKSSSNATNSIFALSGIVQDAPYGFRAIANNITFFTQQMAYSAKASGGFGAALKAMGASFAGPAGIIFAISAGVSLLDTFLGSTKKTEASVDELAQKIKSLRDGLKSMTDVQGDTISSAAKQTAELRLLYNAATDVTRSQKERLKAAQDLQKAQPKTFGAISQLKIISGEASGAFDKLSASILKVAQANVVLQEMEKNLKIIGDAQKEFDKTIDPEKLKKLTGNYLKQQKTLDAMSKSASVSTLMMANQAGKVDDAKNALNAYSESLNKFKGVQRDAENDNTKLAKSFNALDFKIPPPPGGGKGLKTVSGVLADLAAKMAGADSLAKVLGLSIEQVGALKMKALSDAMNNLAYIATPAAIQQAKALGAQYDKIGKATFLPTLTGGRAQVNAPGITNPGVPTQAIGQPNLQVDTKKLGNINRQEISPFLESLKNLKIISDSTFSDMNDKISKNIGAANVLAGAFENIFSAAANGQNPFDALIQSVEQLIIKLAAAAAAVALLNFIPGGSAVLGVLDLASKASSFATGGYIPGPQLAVVGDAPGGEWVLNQKQISAILNGSGQRNSSMPSQITLRAAGADLVAVIDTNNRKQNRRG